MKAQIHPKWHQTEVSCVCGNTFTIGSTMEKIEVDVCSACHPFYTKQMKFVDTAGRVDAFRAKTAKAKEKVLSKTEKRKLKKQKRLRQELEKPDSLADLRK